MRFKSMLKALTFVVLCYLPAWAGTYTAASCNRSDVNAVINGGIHTAVDGDVINVPSGNCTWTSSLSVAVGISIIGAGSGSTIIQDSLNGTLFQVSIPSATSSLFRLSGMTIQPAAGQGGQPSVGSISGTCNSSTCSNIRLDLFDPSMARNWIHVLHR